VPKGGSFDDMLALKGDKEIGDKINKIISRLAAGHHLQRPRLPWQPGRGRRPARPYEYSMRHFATESGKSEGQFYTPAEVSRVLAKVVGIGPHTDQT
jgi:type I restriction enzyme M protein